ncbi:unnamed protein product [Rhizoctonia solani]|uniref:Choline transport protein n=1 Tax=Rhizoctonia solani TaxID=456999 RepID=A0A8H3CYQ7_9AGAM|nr:unnamed protein product [Rhizoctonia solani]
MEKDATIFKVEQHSDSSRLSSEAGSPGSVDGERLARMGYKPELKRNLGIGSLLGFGFSVSNSWWGASASLAAGILSGGPVVMVYGLVFLALISVCIGVSLSELASAMPNSGGQYYWAGQIAPKKHARLLAFLTGALNWAGAVFASSSVTLGLASSLVGLYVLGHPETVTLGLASSLVGLYVLGHPETTISPWMVFVTYQVVNVFGLVFNCIHRTLPALATASLYISVISWLVTTIIVPSMSSTKQSAQFVFATFINQTGWNNDALAFIVGLISPSWYVTKQSAQFVFATFINQTGWNNDALAFIVGLISPSWCFAALDVATHMAEEIHQPERMIPRSILITVLIGLVSSLTYTIAMIFSIADFEAVTGSSTGVPILELYHQATGSLAGAIGLQVLFLLTGVGCLIGCHSWQARLAWSFSRDHGLPGSRWWSVVNNTTGVPLNAHLMSCNMNYASVVIVGYIVYLCGYWCIRGCRVFRVPEVDGEPVIRDND